MKEAARKAAQDPEAVKAYLDKVEEFKEEVLRNAKEAPLKQKEAMSARKNAAKKGYR